MKNNDWQEAYYDLVNKVECECVQQGDLVPIWDQFKAMSAELAKFKALAETLAGALDKSRDGWANALEFGLIPERHRNTAEILAQEAAEALREYKEARDAS